MTTVARKHEDEAVMAHLLRRAGFGATRDQIDQYVARGYEETVEDLLNPSHGEPEDQDLMDRYFIASVEARSVGHADPQWSWRLATSEKPLEEKIALFWHSLLAVGGIKLDHGLEMLTEIELFRRVGLGSFRTILFEISRNPGMMYWLDNQNSHKDAPNENYGRELLELFSMGIDDMGEGDYTEDDVKTAARAFTGWASKPTPPPFFLGPFPMEFRFDASDHDNGEKSFLGETGNFDGENIIDIIVKKRATARFIAMRLYLYFVSDEPDDEEIERLTDVFQETDGDIRSILRSLFNSDHFKSAAVRFHKVKSPAELVFGAARLTDRFDIPDMDSSLLANQSLFMGQHLLNPPGVEGWHEGEEWVDSGSLIERINFAASELGRVEAPGIRRMIELVELAGDDLQPEEFVEACLDAMGSIDLDNGSKAVLVEHAGQSGSMGSADRIVEMFQLIVSTPDYQYC
ncbi:MAG: DUF1800 domain-containing protein [Dehalococcoidia bacterium]|nr:DUF1800 domain-containing protein [Dehalococcoidia bacterium]|tara:strand:+ start:2366 stop:3745 length:1380 start_codon:yes stop_codon:yes gene_type:complete